MTSAHGEHLSRGLDRFNTFRQEEKALNDTWDPCFKTVWETWYENDRPNWTKLVEAERAIRVAYDAERYALYARYGYRVVTH